jgi:hypothetical protein
MSLPESRWRALTSGERAKLARKIMMILLPTFGGLTLLGILLLMVFA